MITTIEINKNDFLYQSQTWKGGTIVKIRTTLFSAALLAASATPAAAEAPDAVSGPRVGGWDRQRNEVMFGGYYEMEYEDNERVDGEDGEADFDQHRFILFIGARPHDRIRLFSELEFEHGADPDDLKFEQAWLEFDLNEDHSLRAGVDLIPVGRLNINHDGNLRDFVFRPEVDERIIPTTWYEAGVWLNGSVPLSDDLSYVVGVSNGLRESNNVGSINEIRGMRRTNALSKDDNNNNKALSGRLAWSPWLGGEFGLSGYLAKFSNTDPPSANGRDDIAFWAIDASQTWGPWEIKGEYAVVDKDREVGNANAIHDARGGYLEVAYHFFPESLRDAWFARGFDNPVFTLLGRAEGLDFDVPGNPNLLDYNVYSVGFNYRPMEQMAFKISYDHFDREDDTPPDSDRFGLGMVLGF